MSSPKCMRAGSSESTLPELGPFSIGRKTCCASRSGVGWGKGQGTPQPISRIANRTIEASARILRLSCFTTHPLIALPHSAHTCERFACMTLERLRALHATGEDPVARPHQCDLGESNSSQRVQLSSPPSAESHKLQHSRCGSFVDVR